MQCILAYSLCCRVCARRSEAALSTGYEPRALDSLYTKFSRPSSLCFTAFCSLCKAYPLCAFPSTLPLAPAHLSRSLLVGNTPRDVAQISCRSPRPLSPPIGRYRVPSPAFLLRTRFLPFRIPVFTCLSRFIAGRASCAVDSAFSAAFPRPHRASQRPAIALPRLGIVSSCLLVVLSSISAASSRFLAVSSRPFIVPHRFFAAIHHVDAQRLCPQLRQACHRQLALIPAQHVRCPSLPRCLGHRHGQAHAPCRPCVRCSQLRHRPGEAAGV